MLNREHRSEVCDGGNAPGYMWVRLGAISDRAIWKARLPPLPRTVCLWRWRRGPSCHVTSGSWTGSVPIYAM